MITIKVTPARRRFDRTPRKQWKFVIVAGNNRFVDPRDTYANTGDIKEVWSKIVASEEPVQLEIHQPDGYIEWERIR